MYYVENLSQRKIRNREIIFFIFLLLFFDLKSWFKDLSNCFLLIMY